MNSPQLQLLPIIQSIPHGGLAKPAEVAARLRIDDTDIYNECDLWVDDLYDVTKAASPVATLASITMPIARAIVDANRVGDDFENPDGAIKQESSYGVPTFDPPLSLVEMQLLVAKYWRPWHEAVGSALHKYRGSAKLMLDCHSMAQRGPARYAFAGAARPLICLANLGNAQGEVRGEEPFAGSLSCPAWFIQRAGEIAEDCFGDLNLLERDGETPPVVALNWPFVGGFVEYHYSSYAQPLVQDTQPRAPWTLMIEVNRGLYVGNQESRTPIAPPNLERIVAVRDRLANWMRQVSLLLPSSQEGDA